MKAKSRLSLFSPSFIWVVFLLDSITPLLLIMDNLGYSVLSAFKAFSFLYIFSATLIALKYKLKFNFISLLFLVFGFISLIIGLIYNPLRFDSFILSSLFGFINPILMTNYARVYMSHFSKEEVSLHFKTVFKYYVPITVVLYFMYFFFHYVVGRYVYYGFQTNWQFASVFLLNQGKNVAAVFGIALVIFAGKRATLITSIIPFITHFFSFSNLFKSKYLIRTIGVFVAVIYLFNVANERGAFRRFESTLNMDFSDLESLEKGTGGRAGEVYAIFNYLNEEGLLLFGAGMNATYIVEYSEYTMEKNFSHFGPAHFSYQYGIIFTALLYLFFIVETIKGYKNNKKNIFYNFFLVVFIGSFFGAGLMVDPKTWFFIGLNMYKH